MNTIKDFRDKNIGFIIEKVNGIPLCNEQDIQYETYYINVKIDINIDWENISEINVYRYIDDTTPVIDYWLPPGCIFD
jgi:hypothetical protein